MTRHLLRRSTQWNPLNEVYLYVSSFSVTGFSNWSFADFEQLKIDIHIAEFWPGQNWQSKFTRYFPEFGQNIKSQKNNPNPHRLIKDSRTTHRIWYMSFLMIHSVGIKNWVLQWVNKIQRFNLLFLFVTRFSDFCNEIKYVC